MFIQLWSFKKRPNSTKQPLPSDPNMIFLNNVSLKEETDVISPTLLISEKLDGIMTSPTLFNYVCIPQWERYYFVTNWRYCNPIWEVDLTVDVLASYREMIGDTEAYIMRNSNLFDGDIVDTKYPTKTDVVVTKQGVLSDIYHTTIPTGCFVVGTISDDSNNRFGAVSYYALTNSQLGALLHYLFSDAIYTAENVYEVSEGLWKAIMNPFQYIVSCTWFPFQPEFFGNGYTAVKVGYWTTGITAISINYLVKEFGFHSEVALKNHPQISRGSYLNHSPYTQIMLYYPPFGNIPIDTDFCQFENNWLYGKIDVDCITGIADMRLSITDGYDLSVIDPEKIFCTRGAQIGVPVQLAQLMPDIGSSVLTGGSPTLHLFDYGEQLNVGEFIGKVFKQGPVNAVATTGIQAMKANTTVSTSGANGSLLEIIEPPRIIIKHYLLTEEDRAEIGRPLCKKMRIFDVGGYIVCSENDYPFTGTQLEREKINDYMSTGFYFE